MKLKNALFLSAMVFGAFFLTGAAPVSAVSISPLTFDLTVNPGDVMKNTIRVFNDQSEPITVHVDIENFVPSGEEGNVVLDGTANQTYSLSSWVTASPEEFTIPPNASQATEFTIRVPNNAEPGGHYGSVLASITPTAGPGAVGVAQKVGSLILLRVSGSVHEELKLLDFNAPGFSEYGPVTFTTRVENAGTIHLKPRGFITIKNAFGKEIAKLDFPQSNVLPASVRRIEVPWEAKGAFGRYDATLLAIYGSTNEPITWTIRFWIIPWKLIGGIVLIVLILLILMIRARRRLSLALSVLMKGEGARG